MSSTEQGIFKYSKMNDKDKSYLVKLIGTLIAAVIAGIITGIIYTPGQPGLLSTGQIGFIIWVIAVLVLSYYIKIKFDLKDMSNQQIIRHGIFLGFLSYIFIWTIIFDYIIYS